MHVTMVGDHPDGAAPPESDQSCRGCVPIDWQTSIACNHSTRMNVVTPRG
jgi:hypothetical protein